jgi:1,4-alpha-glucan branching enzyme
LPAPGRWRELLNTDAVEWGGSGVGNYGAVVADEMPWHGQRWSAAITLPPLGVLWLTPD